MRLILSLCFLILFSCESAEQYKLKQGDYRALLEVQEGKTLPFNFKVTDADQIEIYNADEVILVDEIEYSSDSIRINFPVYEGYIAGRFENGIISGGQYIKESLDRRVPFSVEYDNNLRFEDVKEPRADISGIWEMLFTENDSSTFIAKGIFNQKDARVTGTIRTTTGDYRYLEGVMDGEELKLSTFDGAHAFLFTASFDNDQLSGYFYSGNHYRAAFTAKPNAGYELPDENSLTFLKEGYDRLEFTFPNERGESVSLNDKRYNNKVVVVQIMGTWCPNCLDESKFYSKYYRDNKDKDIEFIALAFEYAKTEEKAFEAINRLQDRVDIEYPILLAQYGSSSKEKAQEKLPMLNHVLSYPTSIFIDRSGRVRKIHTGFNGPATGDKYNEFVSEFDSFVNLLLNE
ncbi:MAG: TlpA family protein disulfide reductase [Flavobacteriaceae bacterium]|nr:TlpA family protein disulfide reductase [Flavobacteriaceae bacterium]